MRKKRSEKNILVELPELKAQLQELARVDIDKFFRILGVDGLQFYICSGKGKGKSLQQITNSLKAHGIEITRQSVGDRCRKCGDLEESPLPLPSKDQ